MSFKSLLKVILKVSSVGACPLNDFKFEKIVGNL